MHCAYALLLWPQQPELYPDRLVVLANHGKYHHYGVYKPMNRGQFPAPESEKYLLMTGDTPDEYGTYLKAYCSSRMPISQIVSKIIEGLSVLTTSSHLDFGTTNDSAQACLERVLNLSDSMPHGDIITITDIRQNHICSDINIVHLAYSGEISEGQSVEGFFPHNPEARIKIRLDQPINVMEVVSESQLLGQCRIENKLHVLAWYLGHLHIFYRITGSPLLYPLTKIGEETANGKIIESFIFQLFEPFKDFKQAIKTFESEQEGLTGWCSRKFCAPDKTFQKMYPTSSVITQYKFRGLKQANFQDLDVFRGQRVKYSGWSF
ncbi:BgtAc-31414 [Blumeria graminis f. sp. tritici]|uniref:BgtAc-31414 n=2 Tax=Blumeria graminis f. sp. tritici TaxID=62690 RepID=A0A9X9MKG1_BLUGR|nr:BgtAc-31414 [Blumeria graminis f. sp. tritici]